MAIAVLDAVFKSGVSYLRDLEFRIVKLAEKIDDESQKYADLYQKNLNKEEKYQKALADNNNDQSVQDVIDAKAAWETAKTNLENYENSQGISGATSTDFLLLQKLVSEWSIALSVTTNLMKTLGDGYKEVARNY